MKKTLVASVMALALIASANIGWAKASKAPKTTSAATSQPKMKVASGSVVSVDDSKLVISHKVGGKAQETTFALNQDTKKDGELAAGAKATVHYNVVNGENVATAVKAGAAKHAAKASSTKAKS
jgi:hypothetical protein